MRAVPTLEVGKLYRARNAVRSPTLPPSTVSLRRSCPTRLLLLRAGLQLERGVDQLNVDPQGARMERFDQPIPDLHGEFFEMIAWL